eukprot:c1542_g1_i1 orf=64-213(-)
MSKHPLILLFTNAIMIKLPQDLIVGMYLRRASFFEVNSPSKRLLHIQSL